jgi:hypothetical protein
MLANLELRSTRRGASDAPRLVFVKLNVLNYYKPVTGVPGISSAILFVRFVEDAGFFSPFLVFFL